MVNFSSLRVFERFLCFIRIFYKQLWPWIRFLFLLHSFNLLISLNILKNTKFSLIFCKEAFKKWSSKNRNQSTFFKGIAFWNSACVPKWPRQAIFWSWWFCMKTWSAKHLKICLHWVTTHSIVCCSRRHKCANTIRFLLETTAYGQCS